MRRAIDKSAARPLIQTASELVCPHCQGALTICQHRDRYVYRLDGLVHQSCRDKRCPDRECEGQATIYRPLVDLRLALPYMTFGLDVVIWVGEGHLRQGRSLSEIGRQLSEDGVPIHQTNVGRLFRSFLALCKMARGDEEQIKQRLMRQGGIVLMIDGVQFDGSSPVLYLAWDALSGTPLFAVRMEDRGAAALSELLMRVKKMGVPVLGVVTDKEKGLVPAVLKIFPQVPYQLCQTHFLKNSAEPMEGDLQELGASVGKRADKVRKLRKRLDKSLGSGRGLRAQQRPQAAVAEPAAASPPSAPTEPVAASPVAAAQVATSPRVAPTARAASAQSAPAEQANPPSAPAAQEAAARQAASAQAKVGPPVVPITEEELVRTLSNMVRLGARVSGKAPLNPPELVRHQRLEQVRQAALDAAKKKTGRPPGWTA